MIQTVILDRNQKPTEEQIRQIEEAKKEKLYLMKILLNLHRQWKKPFVWLQKTATHEEKHTYHDSAIESYPLNKSISSQFMQKMSH